MKKEKRGSRDDDDDESVAISGLSDLSQASEVTPHKLARALKGQAAAAEKMNRTQKELRRAHKSLQAQLEGMTQQQALQQQASIRQQQQPALPFTTAMQPQPSLLSTLTVQPQLLALQGYPGLAHTELLRPTRSHSMQPLARIAHNSKGGVYTAGQQRVTYF